VETDPIWCPITLKQCLITSFKDVNIGEGIEVMGNKVIAHGKSAHGSLPEQGINAIVKLAESIKGSEKMVRLRM